MYIVPTVTALSVVAKTTVTFHSKQYSLSTNTHSYIPLPNHTSPRPTQILACVRRKVKFGVYFTTRSPRVVEN